MRAQDGECVPKKPLPSSPKRSTLAKCGLVLPEKGSFALTMMAGVLGGEKVGLLELGIERLP